MNSPKECPVCGDALTPFFEDFVSGDTVCTLCGAVVEPVDMMIQSHDVLQPVVKSVNKTVVVVVNELDLHPHWEWCDAITDGLTLHTPKAILSVVANLFKERMIPVDRVLAYAMSRFNIPANVILKNVYNDNNDNNNHLPDDVYTPLVKKLSHVANIDRKSMNAIVLKIRDALSKHPELEFRMPGALVIATYLKTVPENTLELEQLLQTMNIKHISVKKIMPFI